MSLSDCLRELRSEMETVSFRSNGNAVFFTGAQVQSYILALTTYERVARHLEKCAQDAPLATDETVIPFPNPKRPRLFVVPDGDGGSNIA
ncbi:hypothetical protein [Phyllobacterium leguminum]|uniref:Uncharacterized protein n=1 Tax=Phyllobacterium leguminum TaxID=314237 RepID=A0A318T1B3_9HYPH|nr:hypothetical protein [Phyllobacterium leguminum]PYE87528.1 hypothetical protein C7477_11229 [Phyllobacterium leguminum]